MTSSSGHAAQPRVVEVDRRSSRASRGRGSRARSARSAPHRSPAAASSAWRVRPLAARAGLQLAHLLERVDDDVAVAADRQPHAGVAVAQRREVAVAEVALGRRAGRDDRAARGEQRRRRARRRGSPCTTVVRAAEEAGAVQQLDRRAAVLGAALLELARLLVGVDVADQPVGVGVGGDLAQPVGRHGADAVRGDADRRDAAPTPQRVDAREERVDARVAEARAGPPRW